MAFPTGPLNEPQHRLWYSSQESGNVVLPRRDLPGVEVNRLVALGPWKTFVPSSFQYDSLLSHLCHLAGSGKSVIWFVDYRLLLSEVIDISCQFHSDPRC